MTDYQKSVMAERWDKECKFLETTTADNYFESLQWFEGVMEMALFSYYFSEGDHGFYTSQIDELVDKLLDEGFNPFRGDFANWLLEYTADVIDRDMD